MWVNHICLLDVTPNALSLLHHGQYMWIGNKPCLRDGEVAPETSYFFQKSAAERNIKSIEYCKNELKEDVHRADIAL